MSAKRRPGGDSPFSKLFTDSAYGVVPPAPVVEPEPVALEPISEPVPTPVSAPISEPISEPVPVRVSTPVPEPVAETPAVSAPIVPPVVTAEQPEVGLPIGSPSPPPIAEPPRRRGRPATGKRSDPNWLGRTFYIHKGIDSQIEIELLKLKQTQGLDLDKSELVNGLLAAWLQAQQTGQASVSMAEILKVQRPQDPPSGL
jgi:hypothetical protein